LPEEPLDFRCASCRKLDRISRLDAVGLWRNDRDYPSNNGKPSGIGQFYQQGAPSGASFAGQQGEGYGSSSGLETSNNHNAVITNMVDTAIAKARTRLIQNRRIFIDPAPSAECVLDGESFCRFVTGGSSVGQRKNKLLKVGVFLAPR
jgi:hypothetical protein